MSLEAKLELLTAAVIELTAAIGAMQAPGPVVEETRGGLTHEEYQNARLPNSQADAKSTDTTSGQQSAQIGESSSPELTYKDHVKPVTLKLSKEKGREVTIAVLGRFGVKGAQELDQAQWGDYIAHCEKVLAGGEV